MYDAYYERLRQGYRKEKKLKAYLHRMERKNNWIGFIRLRFTSSQAIYPLGTTNPVHQERMWDQTRTLLDTYIQEWTNNAFRGNTRTRKRSHDPGWELIGFFHRGVKGFLHFHGFLCINRDENNALRCDTKELMTRLMNNTYHDLISDVYIEQCWIKKDRAIRYASKDAWRPGSGEEFVFARASGFD